MFKDNHVLAEPAILRSFELKLAFNAEHTRPDGTDCFTVSSLVNGENIAKGQTTAQVVMTSWMNSQGHKENILRAEFTSVAVGCVEIDGTVYWVQLFGTGTNPDPDPDPDPTAKHAVTFNSNGGSSVSNQSVDDGSVATNPAIPTRTNYSFIGWFNDSSLTQAYDFSTPVTAPITLYAKWVYVGGSSGSSGGSTVVDNSSTNTTSNNSSSNNNSSSSNRSSNGSNYSSADTVKATPKVEVVTSKNVDNSGIVSQSIITTEAQTVLKNSSANKTAIIKVTNANAITQKTISHLATLANGKDLVVYMNTTTANNKAVQGRIYFEPAKLTVVKSDFKLGIYTDSEKTASTKAYFEKYFSNKIAVVKIEQANFGARLQIAAKVDLKGLNSKTLMFYTYNKTNVNKLRFFSNLTSC